MIVPRATEKTLTSDIKKRNKTEKLKTNHQQQRPAACNVKQARTSELSLKP